jgi:hypothetical protein
VGAAANSIHGLIQRLFDDSESEYVTLGERTGAEMVEDVFRNVLFDIFRDQIVTISTRVSVRLLTP